MRRFITLLIALGWAHLALAGTLPLSPKDITLMVRMGYPTESILRDLATRRFAGPLDENAEMQLRQLNASPALLQALKSGQFNATAEQLAQAQQKIAVAEELAQQQQGVAVQTSAVMKSGPTEANPAQHADAHAKLAQKRQAEPRIIDMQFNQPLDLRQFDGPNVQLIVNGTDMSDVLITLVDYQRMKIRGGGGVSNGEGGFSMKSEPTRTSLRVKKEADSVLYSWGQTKLVYIDAMDTAMNHVKVGIVSE
jgi:hypothetical protein